MKTSHGDREMTFQIDPGDPNRLCSMPGCEGVARYIIRGQEYCCECFWEKFFEDVDAVSKPVPVGPTEFKTEIDHA